MGYFEEAICRHARQLFVDGEVEVLVVPSPGPGNDDPIDPSVRVTHGATGISVTCGDYPSQNENLAAALIKLKIACDIQIGIRNL